MNSYQASDQGGNSPLKNSPPLLEQQAALSDIPPFLHQASDGQPSSAPSSGPEALQPAVSTSSEIVGPALSIELRDGQNAPGTSTSLPDDSPDDELTLAQRCSRLPANAAPTSSREEDSFDGEEDLTSSSDGEEDPEKHGSSTMSMSKLHRRRRRRNILPRIMRGQRCGHCHTCLNPQMKKACLTMRQKQMEEMQKRGELPVSLMAQVPSSDSSGPQPSAPPATKGSSGRKGPDFSGLETDAPRRTAVRQTPPPEDTFSKEIQAIVNRNGGVEVRFLPVLQHMYHKEIHLERKLVLMTVLKQSPAATLKEAVRTKKIIVELQQWLQAAVESKDFRLASRIIEMLDKLPVDLAALQSTGIGKTLAKLRKAGPEELRRSADSLVTKWKKAVDSDTAPAADAAKRPREPASEVGVSTLNKRQKAAGGAATKAAKPKAELPRQSSLEDRIQAGAPAPVEVDDTSMFERKRPAASLQDSVFQMRKAHQLKVLNEDAVKRLKGQEASEEGPDRSAATPSPPQDETAAVPMEQEELKSQDPRSEESRKGGRPPPSAFASARLSAPLGSSRLSGAGMGVTRIGGLGGSLSPLLLSGYEAPLDAAARAAAAAARVPDPPEPPRRASGKTVSWIQDDHLVLVRWFRQADPVVAVKEDAKETTEIDTRAPATAEEAHPPGFVSAAKKEHQNEAAALRKQQPHTQDDEEAHEEHREAAAPGAAAPPPPGLWRPMVEWPALYRGPPLAVDLEPGFGIPSEEERRTAAFQEAAAITELQPPVAYVTALLAPHTPMEPLPDLSAPGAPLRIPWVHVEAPMPGPVLLPPSKPAAVVPQHLPPPMAPPLLPPQQPRPPAMGMYGPRPARPPPGGPRGPRPPALPPPANLPAPPKNLPPRPNTGPSVIGPGRGRQGRGDDGRGRMPGRGGRAGRKPAEDFPGGRGGRRRATDGPKPVRTPCKWHSSGRGCKNGDSCRFSHAGPDQAG